MLPFLNRNCFWRVRTARSVARRVAVCVFLVGGVSDHSRIGRTLEMTLQPFSANFSSIWECNFEWQAQHLVRLEGDACCSAHCK